MCDRQRYVGGANGCAWVLMVSNGSIGMGKPGGTQKGDTKEQETVRREVCRTERGIKFPPGMWWGVAAGVRGQWEESG